MHHYCCQVVRDKFHKKESKPFYVKEVRQMSKLAIFCHSSNFIEVANYTFPTMHNVCVRLKQNCSRMMLVPCERPFAAKINYTL